MALTFGQMVAAELARARSKHKAKVPRWPMKVYLSGPMTGIDQHNFRAFTAAAAWLREQGYEVFNPAETADGDTTKPREWYMRIDVRAVSGSDLIVLLPGWERSRGARLELLVAWELGMESLTYHPDEAKRLLSITRVDAPWLTTAIEHGLSIVQCTPPPGGDSQFTVNAQSRAEMAAGAGTKSDYDKLRYDLVPADALHELVRVYTIGARKYTDRNWERGMKFSRPFGALMRHAWAYWRGEEIDTETNVHHMACATFNCLALLAYALREMHTYDDRPTKITTGTEGP